MKEIENIQCPLHMIWKELVKVGLMGTDRSQIPTVVLEELSKKGISIEQDPAGVLLKGASIYALMQKSGEVLSTYDRPMPEKDKQEITSFCSPPSVAHLELILSGRYADALPEFIDALVDRRKNIPPEMLPDLIEKARSSNSWWEGIRSCIGSRGEWLIYQNFDWHFLLKEMDETVWETGKTKDRLAFLKKLRQSDPVHAIGLLTESWKTESIPNKKKMIQTLQKGLSKADESFLENCLDESQKEIRRFAAKLLAQIPNSDLVERMIDRLRPLIQIKKRKTKKVSLEVQLPENFDDSMIRDGIDPSAQWYQGGLKASRLVQMVVLVPPTKLEQMLDLSSLELLEAMIRSEYADLLIQSIMESTALHQAETWLELLLQFWLENYDKQRWQNLQAQNLLPIINADQFDQIAFKYLSIEEGIPEENTPLDLLLKTSQKWSDRLGILFVKKLQKWMVSDDGRYWGGLHIRRILKKAAYQISPQLYPTLSKGWPYDSKIWAGWEEDVERFLATLQFRQIMIEKLEE